MTGVAGTDGCVPPHPMSRSIGNGGPDAAALLAPPLQSVLLLRQGAPGERAHVALAEDEPGVGRGVVVERGVVGRQYSFTRVFGPHVELPCLHRAVAQRLIDRTHDAGSHPLLAAYGSIAAARAILLGDDTRDGLVSTIGRSLVATHAGRAVGIQITALKGDKAMGDVLAQVKQGTTLRVDATRPRPHAATVVKRVDDALLEALPHILQRHDDMGTLILTYCVDDARGSKLSVVVFESLGRPSQTTTRKHAYAVGDMMRCLYDDGRAASTASALRLMSRKSKLTQWLHTSDPPALAPYQDVVFLTATTTHLDDAKENALRYASELFASTGGSLPTTIPLRLAAAAGDSPPRARTGKREASSSPAPHPNPPLMQMSQQGQQGRRGSDDQQHPHAAVLTTAHLAAPAPLSMSAREESAVHQFRRRQQQLEMTAGGRRPQHADPKAHPQPLPQRMGGSPPRARGGAGTRALERHTGAMGAAGASPRDADRIRGLEEDLIECKAALYDTREILSAMEARVTTAEQQRRAAEAQLDAATKTSVRSAQEVEGLREAKRGLQVRLSELEVSKEALERSVLGVERRLAVASGEKSAALKDLDAATAKLADAEAEVQRLQEREACAGGGAVASPRSYGGDDDSLVHLSATASTGLELAAVRPRASLPAPSEWRHSARDEVVVLRGNLEEAQSHVRRLSQQLAGLAADDDGGRCDEVAILAESLAMQQELSRTYCAKLEAYERRLEAVLYSGDDGVAGPVDGDAVRLLQTTVDKYERLWRKAELDFREAKLEQQAAEARSAARVRDLQAAVAALEGRLEDSARAGREVPPEVLQAEAERVQLLQRQLRELAGKDAEKERLVAALTQEVDTLREDNESLSVSVGKLQKVEQSAHLNLTKLAEASLSNSHMKSDLHLLQDELAKQREDADRTRQQLAAAAADAEGLQRENDDLRQAVADVKATTAAMEGQCTEYEQKMQEMHDGYVEKTTFLTESLRTEKAEGHALRAAKAELEAEVADLKAVAGEGTGRVAALDAEVERLRGDVDAARRDGAAWQARAEEEGRRAAALDERVGTLEADARERAAELAALSARLQDTRSDDASVAQHKELVRQLQVKGALIAQLERQLARTRQA